MGGCGPLGCEPRGGRGGLGEADKLRANKFTQQSLRLLHANPGAPLMTNQFYISHALNQHNPWLYCRHRRITRSCLILHGLGAIVALKRVYNSFSNL